MLFRFLRNRESPTPLSVCADLFEGFKINLTGLINKSIIRGLNLQDILKKYPTIPQILMFIYQDRILSNCF